MLISIYNSVPFDFVEIQKTETCADYFEDSYGNIDIKTSKIHIMPSIFQIGAS